ncbi:hypothetical protein H5410_016766 [Solanum commersonii]|uniref:Uncharacterized protein n=1 Tax=Solanum commersonii TaxID=4109 RepID=A0A9J5ZX97_SOLCO|nr:hypothetical protein H5410_016766 [Solanum commersonii]
MLMDAMLFIGINAAISPYYSKYCFAGVAIGGGWQGLVAYINLRSYYVFGIPLGYTIGYVPNLNLGVLMKQY